MGFYVILTIDILTITVGELTKNAATTGIISLSDVADHDRTVWINKIDNLLVDPGAYVTPSVVIKAHTTSAEFTIEPYNNFVSIHAYYNDGFWKAENARLNVLIQD